MELDLKVVFCTLIVEYTVARARQSILPYKSYYMLYVETRTGTLCETGRTTCFSKVFILGLSEDFIL